VEERQEERWVAIVGGCRYISSCMHGLAIVSSACEDVHVSVSAIANWRRVSWQKLSSR